MKKFVLSLALILMGIGTAIASGTLTITRSSPVGDGMVRLWVQDKADSGKTKMVVVVLKAENVAVNQKVVDAVDAKEAEPIPTPQPRPTPRVIRYTD